VRVRRGGSRAASGHFVERGADIAPAGDPHLGEGDVRFEPSQALVSGVDGLEALRVIVAGAGDHLVPRGWLAVEHGYDQADAVRGLLQQAGFGELESLRDLSGIPRVAVGRTA